MLDIGSSELLLIVIVAVVVIGPKDLPRVLYKLGQIIGKGRAMTRHFRAGIDEMVRQAELEEMQKKWAADNARIMAETQATDIAAGTLNPATEVTPKPASLEYHAPASHDLHGTAEAIPPAYQSDPGHMTPPSSPAGDPEPLASPSHAPKSGDGAAE